MIDRKHITRISAALATLATALVAAPALAVPVSAKKLDVSYLYGLASPTGVLPLSDGNVSYDAEHGELLLAGSGLVRIFNRGGMETYSFGNDPELGWPLAAVSLEDGDLVVLSLADGERTELVRCDFRGVPRRRIELRGLPAELAGFVANTLAYRNGNLYLASSREMRAVVADVGGKFLASHDLAALAGGAEKREEAGLGGFNVDARGNILFTVPTMFQAFVVAPDGTVSSFGTKGSAPGKFNIVGGIAADGDFIYVTDVLKSAVLVFDRELRFVREFGYRGRRPQNLLAPTGLQVAEGKLYVTQKGRRGVSVFKISSAEELPN